MDFGAHIRGFRSTHQYYKTAKYELHPTTGDVGRSAAKINLIVANRSQFIKKLQQCSFHPVLTDQKIFNSKEVTEV